MVRVSIAASLILNLVVPPHSPEIGASVLLSIRVSVLAVIDVVAVIPVLVQIGIPNAVLPAINSRVATLAVPVVPSVTALSVPCRRNSSLVSLDAGIGTEKFSANLCKFASISPLMMLMFLLNVTL